MFKFLYIILKNLLRTYRAKRFVVISLVSPIILVLVIGFIFATQSLSNVKIGTIGNRELLASIGDINVVPYTADDVCIRDVKHGDMHACVIIPNGTIGNNTNITIFTDFSKISLANSIVSAVTKEISKAKGSAEINVLKSVIASAEGMRSSIKDMIIKLTVLKADLIKSRDELTTVTEKQKSFSEIKSRIDENQKSLRDFSVSLQDADSDIAKPISTLNSRKKDIENELAECTQVSLAVSLDFLANDCTKSQVDANQYSFLFAVSCSNYTSLLRTFPVTECDALNIADTIINKKLAILKEQQNETDTTLQSLQSLKSTLGNSKSSIANLQMTLESIKDIDVSSGISADKLNKTIQELEASEKNLATNLDFAPVNIGNQLSITASPVTAAKTEQQFFNLIAFVLLITFSTVLVSSSLLLNEKSSPAFIRNFISPTNEMIFFIGIFINNFLVAIFQAVIFFTFLIINGTYLPINVADAIISLFLIEAALVLIGMLLAVLFEKRETAILGTVTALIILLILSGILIPVEKMSGYAYLLGKFSPVAMIMEISRKVILFNLSLQNVITETVYLSIFSIVMFFVVWYINKLKMRF